MRGSDCIFLVDDDEALINFLDEMIPLYGYTVKTSINGDGALKLFQQDPKRIDLAVTDQTMPKLTGDKLAVQLLAIRPELSIILTTGFSELIDEVKVDEISIQHFLMKPFTSNTLLAKIQDLLPENTAKVY